MKVNQHKLHFATSLALPADQQLVYLCLPGQASWPVATASKSGPGLIAARPPALSNPIIHPREQLDWGEPDDRWTVSPDCADLIEERVQALMGRRPLVKGEGKSSTIPS